MWTTLGGRTMATKPTTKSPEEAAYVREKLQQAMKERQMGVNKVAEILGVNKSNISKFLAGKSQLNDETIEKLYELDWFPRPTEADLAQNHDEKIGETEYRSTEALHVHPINSQIYNDQADDELMESINEYGILTPLVITSEGLVISGHRRLDAARRLGIEEVPVRVIEVEADELEIEKMLIEANRQRQKSNEQIGREYMHLKRIEAEKAKQRMASGAGDGARGKAGKIAAEALGIGEQKAARCAKVIERIDELRAAGKNEEAEELRQCLNEKSVNAAFDKMCTPRPWKCAVQRKKEQEGGSVNSRYLDDEHEDDSSAPIEDDSTPIEDDNRQSLWSRYDLNGKWALVSTKHKTAHFIFDGSAACGAQSTTWTESAESQKCLNCTRALANLAKWLREELQVEKRAQQEAACELERLREENARLRARSDLAECQHAHDCELALTCAHGLAHEVNEGCQPPLDRPHRCYDYKGPGERNPLQCCRPVAPPEAKRAAEIEEIRFGDKVITAEKETLS